MENVTITSSTFFDECKETKWMSNASFREAVMPYNRTTTVGSLMYLYDKYGRPKTIEEFFNKYTTDTTGDDVVKCGKSNEQIIQWAKDYQKRYVDITKDTSISFDLFYKNMIYRLFGQTIEGRRAENELVDYINSHTNCTATTTAYDIDTAYGADINVVKPDGSSFFIQVKAISYIASNKYDPKIYKSRMQLIDKNKKAKKDLKMNTYYCFYRKNPLGTLEWCLDNNNKMCYTLDGILTRDGNSVFNQYNKKWR